MEGEAQACTHSSVKIAILSLAITGIIIPGETQDHIGKSLPSSGLPISGILWNDFIYTG